MPSFGIVPAAWILGQVRGLIITLDLSYDYYSAPMGFVKTVYSTVPWVGGRSLDEFRRPNRLHPSFNSFLCRNAVLGMVLK